MFLSVLKSKLHRAVVTHVRQHYEGSCAIDPHLMERADIHPYEQVHVYNVDNGERFTTYAIYAKDGAGTISINGAAAHKARPKDRVIICTYRQIEEQRIADYQPLLVFLDERNRVVRVDREDRNQAAA